MSGAALAGTVGTGLDRASLYTKVETLALALRGLRGACVSLATDLSWFIETAGATVFDGRCAGWESSLFATSLTLTGIRFSCAWERTIVDAAIWVCVVPSLLSRDASPMALETTLRSASAVRFAAVLKLPVDAMFRIFPVDL